MEEEGGAERVDVEPMELAAEGDVADCDGDCRLSSLMDSITQLTVLVKEQSVERRGREKLLLERIRVLEDEVTELRNQVSSLVNQLTISKNNSLAKTSWKNTKKRQTSSPPSGVSCHVDSPKAVDTPEPTTLESCGGARARTNSTSGQEELSNGLRERVHVRESSQVAELMTNTSSAADVSPYSESHDHASSDGHPCARATEAPPISIASRERSDVARPSSVLVDAPNSLPPVDEDDDSWQLISSNRLRKNQTRKLFVGNLIADVSKECLTNFISARSSNLCVRAQVHDVYIFPVVEGRKSACASIVVDTSAAEMVLRRDFWPGRVYCRKWRKGNAEPRTGNELQTGDQQYALERRGQMSNEQRADELLATCQLYGSDSSKDLGETSGPPSHDSSATHEHSQPRRSMRLQIAPHDTNHVQ